MFRRAMRTNALEDLLLMPLEEDAISAHTASTATMTPASPRISPPELSNNRSRTSVAAALFLRRFVPEGTPWAHFDTFAWRPSAKPGRPKGGEALGLRAAWAMLKARYPG